MPYSASDLVDRITALETALDRHERTVQFADRTVTYNSTSEIIERIDYFKKQLSQVRGRSRQTVLVGDKGLS